MDYEKAYNKALERAKKWYNAPNADKIPTYANRIIVEIFPELGESEDEKIRKALVRFHKSTIDVDGIKGEEIVAWLEKQSGCFDGWEKNIADNKPALNHSILMKNIHGIAEGEWNGKEWIQYRWSCKVKDSDVLYWMDLHELEKQGEKKPINPNAIKDLERAILAAHPTFKQKPTWSGEDERMVEEILDAIEAAEYEMAFNMSDVRQWLKNLKQRLS